MKYGKILNCFANTKGLHIMGSVRLPSGNISPINLDLVRVFSNHKHLEIIGKALAKEIKKMNVDIIAGVATAGIPLATIASHWSGLPFVYIRNKPDLRTGELIQGHYEAGQKAVLLDDIVGSGNTKQAALKAVRGKLRISKILTLVSVDKHYRPNWRSWTKKQNIKLTYLIDWTDMTKYLIKKNALDKRAGTFLLKFLKDQKWHLNKKLWKQYTEWQNETGLKTGDPII